MTSAKTTRTPSFYAGQHYVVGESTGHLLFQLMGCMRREIEARMAEHDLTDAQWKPLWMMKMGVALTPFELSKQMGCDAGSMTRLLDRLEAKGLIRRWRSEKDRRVVHVQLTPEGEKVAEHIPHVLASINNDFLRGFTKAEWTQFKDMCQRMLVNAQALQGQTPIPPTPTPTPTQTQTDTEGAQS